MINNLWALSKFTQQNFAEPAKALNEPINIKFTSQEKIYVNLEIIRIFLQTESRLIFEFEALDRIQ